MFREKSSTARRPSPPESVSEAVPATIGTRLSVASHTGSLPASEQRRAVRDAGRALADEERHLRKSLPGNVRVEPLVKVGGAANGIGACATRAKSDLIVARAVRGDQSPQSDHRSVAGGADRRSGSAACRAEHLKEASLRLVCQLARRAPRSSGGRGEPVRGVSNPSTAAALRGSPGVKEGPRSATATGSRPTPVARHSCPAPSRTAP